VGAMAVGLLGGYLEKSVAGASWGKKITEGLSGERVAEEREGSVVTTTRRLRILHRRGGGCGPKAGERRGTSRK